MKKANRTIVGRALVAASVCMFWPLAVGSFGLQYTGCVAPTDCELAPPPGMDCDIISPLDGSAPQAGGIGPSVAYCAYVHGYELAGWPCGGAVPTDPPSPNCQ